MRRMSKQESLVEMVDRIIAVEGVSKQDQKIIDFVGKEPGRARKQVKTSETLGDVSDDDYSSMKRERKPIERLINESPDKVVKINSTEYRQLPVID